MAGHKRKVFLMLRAMRLTASVLSSNFCRLRSPYKVTWVLTYRCNLKCRICHIWRHPPCGEMTLEQIDRLSRGLKGAGWLDLTGGELTLRDDLPDIIEIISKNIRHLSVMHVSTNGQLPEKAEAAARKLDKTGAVPVINISMDGPSDLHDTLRGCSGAFDKALETFRRLKAFRAGGHYYLSCTLSNSNLPRVDELIAELKRKLPGFSLKDIHFNLFHQSAHYYKNQAVNAGANLDKERILHYLSLAGQGSWMKNFFEKRYLEGMRQYLSGNRFPVPCQAAGSTCFIDPAGKVYPCGIFDLPLGSLAEYDWDIDRLWNSVSARQVREKILRRQCPGCWSPCEAYPAMLGGLFNFSARNQVNGPIGPADDRAGVS